jgi:hypothetical protein
VYPKKTQELEVTLDKECLKKESSKNAKGEKDFVHPLEESIRSKAFQFEISAKIPRKVSPK